MSPSAPRIAIVTSLLPPVQGGPAGQSAELAKYLLEKGADVALVLVGNQRDVAVDSRLNLVHYRFPKIRVPGIAVVLSFLFAMHHLLRARPKIIHLQVFNNPVCWGFVIAGRILNIKTYCKISSERGIVKLLNKRQETNWRELSSVVSWSDWFLLRMVHVVLATTEEFVFLLAKKYNLAPTKIHYFPNFTESVAIEEGTTDSRRGLSEPSDEKSSWKIVTIARGVRQKNFDGCLLAAKKLLSLDRNFTWRFVGEFDSDYQKELIAEASRLGVEGKVIFVGGMDPQGVRDELNRSDVFVMLSHFEWFGISVLEAMDCGIPVVVSGVPGMGEIARGCGEVVDPANAEAAAQSIMRLMEDRIYRSKCIEESRRRVDEKYRVRVPGDKLFGWLTVD